MRERQRARRWAIRNLQTFAEIREARAIETYVRRVNLMQEWLDAGSGQDVDDRTWCDLGITHTSWGGPPDLSPLIRSEVAISMSREAFDALYGVDSGVRGLHWRARMMRDHFERDVLPLWYERRVPLVDADARRVAEHRDRVLDVAEWLHELNARKRELARQLDLPAKALRWRHRETTPPRENGRRHAWE